MENKFVILIIFILMIIQNSFSKENEFIYTKYRKSRNGIILNDKANINYEADFKSNTKYLLNILDTVNIIGVYYKIDIKNKKKNIWYNIENLKGQNGYIFGDDL